MKCKNSIIKCKNCDYTDGRNFTYCPECGKEAKQKKSLKERLQSWKIARRDNRVIKLTERINVIEHEKYVIIEALNKEELDRKALEASVERWTKKYHELVDARDALIKDRDEHYIALDKKIEGGFKFDEFWGSDLAKYTGTFYIKRKQVNGLISFVDPRELVVFCKADLPETDEDDE